MPGFFVSNKDILVEIIDKYPEHCLSNEIKTEGFTLKRNTLNKFVNDKTFEETELSILVSEGYILNKLNLFKIYDVTTVSELMWKMYMKTGETFFNEFRGAFSGALYDKVNKKWIIYTNHIGDNPIFYAVNDNFFYAGSQVNYIIEACNKEKIKLIFDEDAAYQMLTFGFMENNRTYAEQIKRLRGGTYLCVINGKVNIKEYHTFHKNPKRFEGKTETEIINELDTEFRRVIKLEYQKDDEYNYHHLVDMSGGLDSRMGAWVAHDLNSKQLQLITYSKANYLDELIAKDIAKYWNDELLFKSLDDASFLYDIDEIVELNGGLSLYAGISGGNRILKILNISKFGLEHTGMLGDVIIGSFLQNTNDLNRKLPSGKYSEKLSSRLNTQLKDDAKLFEDHEIYLMYTRGFQGAVNTHLIRKNYTEVISPFLDVDFLQLCLDIPLEFRIGHNIYKKWIIAKYSSATEFKWEKTNSKITETKMIGSIRRIITKGPNKLLRMIGKEHYITSGMNPFAYWIANNIDLMNYLNMYEEENYKYLPSSVSKLLVEDLKELYRTGSPNEKFMVLTVLGSVKMYFGELID